MTIYNKYSGKETVVVGSKDSIKEPLINIDTDLELEYERHKQFLQKSILSLKQEMSNTLNTHSEV